MSQIIPKKYQSTPTTTGKPREEPGKQNTSQVPTTLFNPQNHSKEADATETDTLLHLPLRWHCV